MKVKFRQMENGDIFAEHEDFLLGVWFLQGQRGTYRISNNTMPTKNDSVTAYLHDFNNWIQLMASYS